MLSFTAPASIRNQCFRPISRPLATLHASGVFRPRPRRDLSTAVQSPADGGPIVLAANTSTSRAVMADGAQTEHVSPPRAENTMAGELSSKSSGCSVAIGYSAVCGTTTGDVWPRLHRASSGGNYWRAFLRSRRGTSIHISAISSSIARSDGAARAASSLHFSAKRLHSINRLMAVPACVSWDCSLNLTPMRLTLRHTTRHERRNRSPSIVKSKAFGIGPRISSWAPVSERLMTVHSDESPLGQNVRPLFKSLLRGDALLSGCSLRSSSLPSCKESASNFIANLVVEKSQMCTHRMPY